VEVLRTIDDGEVASVTVHLDQEPLLLYAELDDRGWSHDLLPADADGVHLRLTRQHP
jgi:hypothetical protein